MADTKISGETPGAPAQTADQVRINRSLANFSITVGSIAAYTMTGAGGGTLPVANGGTSATTSTGSGAVVLAMSPALTTPAITGGTINNATVGATTPASVAATSLALTTPANTAGVTLTGYSLTGSAANALLDLSGTWSTTGTPTLIKANVTNTASNAASKLLDLQVGGASSITAYPGVLSAQSSGNATFVVSSTGTSTHCIRTVSGSYDLQFVSGCSASGTGGTQTLSINQPYWFGIGQGTPLTFSAGAPGAGDLQLRRAAAANLAFGNTDAAAPVAQTLSVQSVVAGTTNTAGATWTLSGSQGTGTGVGGNVDIQTATAGITGTAQNALATTLSARSDGTVIMGRAFTVAALPAAGTQGRRAWVTDALAPTYMTALTGGGAVKVPVFDNGTAWVSA